MLIAEYEGKGPHIGRYYSFSSSIVLCQSQTPFDFEAIGVTMTNGTVYLHGVLLRLVPLYQFKMYCVLSIEDENVKYRLHPK